MKNEEFYKKVADLTRLNLATVKNNKPLVFSTNNQSITLRKKPQNIVKLFCIIWLITILIGVLFFVNNNQTAKTFFPFFPYIFLFFCLVIILLLITFVRYNPISKLIYFNSEIQILTPTKKQKKFLYEVDDFSIRSKISKYRDITKSFFKLYVFTKRGKECFDIDVTGNTEDYFAFWISVFLIKYNKKNLSDEECKKYVDDLFVGKSIKNFFK